MMHLHWIQSYGELEAHRDDWNRLAGNSPFRSWEWLGNWYREMAASFQPAVVVATDENQRWLGLVPWYLEPATGWGYRLRLWGSGTACTDYAGMMVKEDSRQELVETLVDWLATQTTERGPMGSVVSVEFEGIDGSCESNLQLLDWLEAAGYRRFDQPLESCWVTSLPPTWESLNASLSKSLRRKTKKAQQRLDDPETQIRFLENTELSSLWPDFVNLHQQRRESLGQPGCFADPRFEKFLRRATHDLSLKGQAELFVIDYQQQPLATMLLFTDGHSQFMYQSGVDVGCMKREPGYQLVQVAMQRSILAGRKAFDFMRGDEPYKARWNTEAVPMLHTRLIPRKFSAVVQHGLWVTGRSLKKLVARPHHS